MGIAAAQARWQTVSPSPGVTSCTGAMGFPAALGWQGVPKGHLAAVTAPAGEAWPWSRTPQAAPSLFCPDKGKGRLMAKLVKVN